jgi:hypothetical protein
MASVTAKFAADFSDFHKETKKAEAGLNDFEKAAGSVARSVATDLLAMFSVGAVTAFVSDTIEAAGALKVLSQQTQISTDDLQLMGAAMSEFGVSQDELGRGLVTLSKKIAGGDDSVAAALASMGLALKDVKDLRGQELFLTIENGLAKLNGSLRDTAAAALFGDKLGAAMAGASEGIDGAMAKARELNTVMSQEAIDALDEYNTAITRAKLNVQNMTANALGPLAEGFNVLAEAVGRGASKWELFAGMLPKGFAGIGTGAEGLTATLDRLNQETERNTAAAVANAAGHEAVTVKLTEEERQTEFLRILQENASKDLTAAQLKNLAALKEIGQLNATNAAGIGVTAAEYKKYLVLMDEEKKKREELIALTKAHQAQVDAAMKAQGDAVGKVLDQIFGAEALQKATAWTDAMNTFGVSVRDLRVNELEELNTTMLAGIDALARSGQLTSQQSSAFATLAAQAQAALAALRPVVTVTEDLVKAQWDYALATDAALAAMAKTNEEAQKTTAAAGGLNKPPGVLSTPAGFALKPYEHVPHDLFGRPGTPGFLSGLGTVRVDVHGNVLQTEQQLAKAVEDAIVNAYRRGGNRLPV